MKVLIVSQYFAPEPVPIPGELAMALRARGHNVRVLTGYPNYPAGVLYPGYRQRLRTRNEMTDGIDVRRVPLYANHSQGALRRFVNYASFAVTSTMARRAARGADVVYIYATQMTAATAPWIWRMTGGSPYVLHVQDLWPDSITGSTMLSSHRSAAFVNAALNPWLRGVYRRAAAVIGIAPTMVRTLIERGVPASKAELVFNWADDSLAGSASAKSKRRGTQVLYAGNVGDMQDLETVVKAAHAASDSGIELRIVGDGVAKTRLVALAAELGATNVSFAESVPRERMAALYDDCDFALVSLRDLPVFRGTIPSKLQAVLAAGLPVISTVQGDVRELVEQEGVGFTADAEDIESIAGAMRAAAASALDERGWMSQRAHDLYVSKFSRESGVARIEALLQRVAEEKSSRR